MRNLPDHSGEFYGILQVSGSAYGAYGFVFHPYACEASLPWLPEDDFEDLGLHGSGTFNAEFDDILKDIDGILGPEQDDNRTDSHDNFTLDEGSFPILPPTVGPREGSRQSISQSPAHLSFLSTTPPSSPPILQGSPAHQRMKKSGLGRAWNKLKRLFKEKFGGDDQAPPKLSDKLVPERDDEVRWYESLFPKPTKPAKTRK